MPPVVPRQTVAVMEAELSPGARPSGFRSSLLFHIFTTETFSRAQLFLSYQDKDQALSCSAEFCMSWNMLVAQLSMNPFLQCPLTFDAFLWMNEAVGNGCLTDSPLVPGNLEQGFS